MKLLIAALALTVAAAFVIPAESLAQGQPQTKQTKQKRAKASTGQAGPMRQGTTVIRQRCDAWTLRNLGVCI